MINYKNTQEGYEADRTTVSYSWGKTCLTQAHQGMVGVKPKVNRKESQFHSTVFCLTSTLLPGENTDSFFITFFSLKLVVTEDLLIFQNLQSPLYDHYTTCLRLLQARSCTHLAGLGDTCAATAAFLSNHPTHSMVQGRGQEQ